MASESHTTTDHNQIPSWVRPHDGTPATVRDHEPGGTAGVLRIHLPGGAGQVRLEDIDWDDGSTSSTTASWPSCTKSPRPSGQDSTFFKLVRRESTL